MKKNLNIAYLNGAEGMIRRGGASSGGSGESGGGDNDNWVYYDISGIPSKVGLIEYALLPALVKIKTDDEVAICGFSSCFANVPTENIESKLNAIHSIAFPLNCKVVGSSIFQNGVILTEEFLDNTMMLQPFKTTKEQFYSLE